MRKKIVVFTGAGISKESGIDTFRDIKYGLWYNHKVEDVATPEGWKRDPEKVLIFHNNLRKLLPTVEPNGAHKALVELEKEYDVTIVTQNVDDLHDRAGSINVIHLHGELTKGRAALYNHKPSPFDEVIDIGYKDINLGDKHEKTGAQIRPHIVWFGEYPMRIEEAYNAIANADILLVIGTSLQITYTVHMIGTINAKCRVIYIDPNPVNYLDAVCGEIEYVKKNAVEGVTDVVNKLLNEVK